MLINLRNALMAGKRLPYDAEVEYLESSGTQYIDTGIKPGPSTRVEITFAMTTFTANCGLFGARGTASADNNSYNLFIISNNGSRVRWDWSGSGQYQTTEAETSTTATYVLGAAGGSITRDGTTVVSVSASKAAINYPLYVFNMNNVGTPFSTGANARFWSVKIYDGQTLVFDAIPVRKGTVGYLYDRVSGKLFGNAGTGDFVLGPDVVPVEYIESHGTEYIDTGLVATANNSFGAEISFDATVIDHGGTGTTNTVCICGANSYATSGFELRWQYASASLIPVGGSYGNYVETRLTENDILSKSIVAKNMNGHITYDADGARIVDKTATVADVGFVTGSVLLFGERRGTSVQGITLLWAKMKYAKFYHNDNITESLIPVRVGTGSTWEGAMMDTLTRRIYRNQGTGAFGYGNDLKYPIPSA